MAHPLGVNTRGRVGGYRTSHADLVVMGALTMISVDKQFTVFGFTGAPAFSALSGLLLHQLLPYRAAAGPPRPAHTPTEATP
jgi:hypothetical protein